MRRIVFTQHDNSDPNYQSNCQFLVEGFDSVDGWNPTVTYMKPGVGPIGGSIKILFRHFPTDLVMERGEFDEFADIMSKAIEVNVTWEDRELFLVERPRPDTLERLQEFFLNYGLKETKQ